MHPENKKQTFNEILVILKDHQELHRSLQEAAVLLKPGELSAEDYSVRLHQFKRSLQEVQRKLLEHLRREESYEFLKEFIEHLPHMKEHWRNLCLEHGGIKYRMLELLEKTEVLSLASADPFKSMRRDFSDFVALLYEHEQRERLLLHPIVE